MNKILMLIAISAIMLTSCATQRFTLDERRPAEPTKKGWNHFFVYGILQTREINLDDICGSNGVSAVETKTGILDSFVGGLTLGVYTPRPYAIYCKQ
jgi:hypothetical protein